MAKAKKPLLGERLRHIEKAIEQINKFTEDMDEVAFLQDEKTQLAVIKLFEIIGEAVYHIDRNFKEQNSHIQWKSIEGMRHVLVHDYYKVEVERIWNTKELFLPDLELDIEQLIEKMDEI